MTCLWCDSPLELTGGELVDAIGIGCPGRGVPGEVVPHEQRPASRNWAAEAWLHGGVPR